MADKRYIRTKTPPRAASRSRVIAEKMGVGKYHRLALDGINYVASRCFPSKLRYNVCSSKGGCEVETKASVFCEGEPMRHMEAAKKLSRPTTSESAANARRGDG